MGQPQVSPVDETSEELRAQIRRSNEEFFSDPQRAASARQVVLNSCHCEPLNLGQPDRDYCGCGTS